MNQWCVKKDKNVFKLAFKFHAFPEIPKMLETRAHKKLSFQHYHETKMLQIIVFWSIREVKIPRNIVFRLNRGIKMWQNSKIVQIIVKLKCRENFLLKVEENNCDKYLFINRKLTKYDLHRSCFFHFCKIF